MASQGTTPRRRRVLRLIVLDLALVLVLLEVVPRLVPIPGMTLGELDPPQLHGDRRRLQPHPYLCYALTPLWRSPEGEKQTANHNSLGCRGPEIEVPKPAGKFRVLCVGGSSTYGSGPTTDERTWPLRLAHHLRRAGVRGAEGVNLGVPGWTSTESLINLTLRGLEMEPDLVVVYHATNDALAAMWGEATWDQTHFRTTWNEPPEPGGGLLSRSRLYLLWRAHFTDYLARSTDIKSLAIADFDAGYSEPDPEREVSPGGFRNFGRNLRGMAALARARGVEVVFVEQAFHPEHGRGEHPHSGALRRRTQLGMLAVQREVAAELDVPLIAAAAVLEDAAREQLAQGGGQQIFTNNVHLKNPGADLLARTIAGELVERDLVPRN